MPGLLFSSVVGATYWIREDMGEMSLCDLCYERQMPDRD